MAFLSLAPEKATRPNHGQMSSDFPIDPATVKLVLAVIEWLARQVARLQGPSKQRLIELEVDVLNYLAERKEWTTPGLIWADLILRPILQDVRFSEAFPPAGRGWPLFKWRIRNFRVNARHRWRMWRHYIPEETVLRVIRRLWREERLKRAPWDELYQVRY